MVAIIFLGIVKEVKLSYLIVGHTHEDGDGTIGIYVTVVSCLNKFKKSYVAGNVVTYLRQEDIPSFADFHEYVKQAINSEEGKVRAVEEVLTFADYEAVFKESDVGKVSGISTMKLIKMSLNKEGKVNIYYKSNSSKEGWYPTPIEEKLKNKLWYETPAHPFDPTTHGKPLSVGSVPCKERQKRQYWEYSATYESGDTQNIILPCWSLPIAMKVC